MTDTDPLVRFDGVRKSYGDFEAVKGIDLTIGRGEFVAIMGPSGCGKTTTLRMLAGLEAPSAGDITIGGKRMNDVPPHERDTPLVWQSLALFPFLNVKENVEFGLKMRGVSDTEAHGRAMLWLERMGLKGFEKRRVDELSGGQRQRVALARSLVTEPQMLLLDEPLSALDAHLVIRMQGVLTRLQRELGITFVYVTHSQSEAFAMADRVVIMGQGEIAQVGAPRDIFRAPRTRFVAEFVGRNNILPGAGGGEISVAADRMTVSDVAPGGTAIEAAFLSEEFAGTGIICYFEDASGRELKAQVSEAELERLSLEPGAKVWLSWPDEAAHPLEPKSIDE
ncbi:ABC transporter ATP-binding protein [Salipiger abyssi]|uniref:ABC transporter ATP-binding protein n=1 Tax=Salipiger abyssi TaxID=1250539 RepID=UPI001A8C2F84|nr:ABC transporter ATP-binding protein [Salipiger abyssi]MBN9890340.1 ABC transporter ATP-binding protein [Salipiger abyssi]